MRIVNNLVSDGGKLWGIEAGRGIAACLVVFYHAARQIKADLGLVVFGGALQFGHAGVDFFFVLSGFIIFYIHAKDLGSTARLKSFFLRRFLRIYPFYWSVLVVTLLITTFSSSRVWPSITLLIESLLLVPHVGEAVVGVAWTLQYEVVFYALFATAIASRQVGLIVFCLWFGLIAWRFESGVDSSFSLIARLSSPFNIEFFLGILAAFLTLKAAVPRPGALFATGSILFLVFGATENLGLMDGYDSLARLAYGVSAMLLVLGLAGGAIPQLGNSSLLVRLGRASYSIYLVHLICIGVMYKVLARVGFFDLVAIELGYLLLVGAGIVGGVFVSRWVEYPLMGWVKRHIS